MKGFGLSTETWKPLNEPTKRVVDMETSHIENCINMLQHPNPKTKTGVPVTPEIKKNKEARIADFQRELGHRKLLAEIAEEGIWTVHQAHHYLIALMGMTERQTRYTTVAAATLNAIQRADSPALSLKLALDNDDAFTARWKAFAVCDVLVT